MDQHTTIPRAARQVDDEFAELFLSEEPPSVDAIRAAVRRATIALKFVPVLCGSAYKNKGARVRRRRLG